MNNNLFTEDIIIKSVDDIEKAISKIIQEKDKGLQFRIIIENLEPIVFKFSGDRFNEDFVPIDILNVANVYKSSFLKYFKTILKKELNEKDLYVNVKRGSFEIDFQQLLQTIISQGINKMNGIEITLVILFGILGWFIKDSFEKYLEKEEKRQTADIAKEAIAALKEMASLQKAKNKPVKTALELLEDDEFLIYGNQKDYAKYSKKDIVEFAYDESEIIKYETLTKKFYIKGINDKNGRKVVVIKPGTKAKFEAISKLEDNFPLYNALEKQEPVCLKIKIGKLTDGTIEEADIFEVIDDCKDDNA